MEGNGNLVITVQKFANKNGDDNAYDYSTTMILSKGKFEKQYKGFKNRCILPTKQGWWVDFWMMQGKVGAVGNGGTDGQELHIMGGRTIPEYSLKRMNFRYMIRV